MNASRRAWTLVGLAVAAALLALPAFGNDYVVGVGLTVLMWIALTQSWCVLSKMTGYVSLGHVVFYGLGAYLVVVTWQQVPLALAIGGAGLLAAAFAALVGLPVLRVRGPYFVILSFGVSELVKFSIMAAESASGTASRILFGAPREPRLHLVAVAVERKIVSILWFRHRDRSPTSHSGSGCRSPNRTHRPMPR